MNAIVRKGGEISEKILAQIEVLERNDEGAIVKMEEIRERLEEQNKALRARRDGELTKHEKACLQEKRELMKLWEFLKRKKLELKELNDKPN